MKKIALFVITALLLVSCHRNNNIKSIDTDVIQTGDLIFVALPTNYDAAPSAEVRHIQSDSDEVIYAHVAIADVVDDSLYVIDATFAHNVERHPFDTLLATYTLPDGSQPRYDVYRLRDNRHALRFIEQAKQFCGQPYDVAFDLHNEAQYCSELVRNSYVTPCNDTLFPVVPLNFALADGTMPPYWQFLFGLINTPIPQGQPGIMPADIAHAPQLQLITLNYKRPTDR